jgi:hypothetical protein
MKFRKDLEFGPPLIPWRVDPRRALTIGGVKICMWGRFWLTTYPLVGIVLVNQEPFLL